MKFKNIIVSLIVLSLLLVQFTSVSAATNVTSKSLMKNKKIVNLVNYFCSSINSSDDSFTSVKKLNGELMHQCVYEFLHENYDDLDKYGYCGKINTGDYNPYEWVDYRYNATYERNDNGIPLKAKNIENIASSFFGGSYNKKNFRSLEDTSLQYYKGKYYFAMADGGSMRYAKITKITNSGKGIYKITATKYTDSEFDEEGPKKVCNFSITIKSDKKSLFGYYITSCKVK